MRKFLMSAAAIAALSFSAPAIAAPQNYEFDKTHTSILFKINHLGFSNMIGEFLDYEGKLVFDEEKPENSKLEVTINTAGVDTDVDELDKHLRNADFFNVEKFPTATFKSTSIKVTGKNTGDVTGDLTLLGVTKPVTLHVTFNKTGVHPYSKDTISGFSATGTLNRSDFGMKYGVPNVGDEVTLIIETEMVNTDKKAAK